MQYFKDPANNNAPWEFEANVTAQGTDGNYTFVVQDTVHVPDFVVHHPAVIVHHDQVLGVDPDTQQPIVVTAAYDEVITAAYDEVTVPAHDELVTILTISNAPSTLVSITHTEFLALEAAIQSAHQAANAAMPNSDGFISDVKTAFGGMAGIAPIAGLATLFFSAVNSQDWTDVHDIVIGAHTSNTINDTQYAAIKTAAQANNIPLTLP